MTKGNLRTSAGRRGPTKPQRDDSKKYWLAAALAVGLVAALISQPDRSPNEAPGFNDPSVTTVSHSDHPTRGDGKLAEEPKAESLSDSQRLDANKDFIESLTQRPTFERMTIAEMEKLTLFQTEPIESTLNRQRVQAVYFGGNAEPTVLSGNTITNAGPPSGSGR